MKLLEAYSMKHNYDIVCLSDTYLEYSIQYDDEKLHLNRNKLAIGGVAIYFKDFLETRQLELNNSNECIIIKA